MRSKTIAVILILTVLATSATAYVDFEQFERENAGITPVSNLYSFYMFFEKVGLWFSISKTGKITKRLENLQERGDELEALTYLNRTDLAYEMETRMVREIRYLKNLSTEEGGIGMDRVNRKTREYMRQSTDSPIYPGELGYSLRQASARAYIETSEFPETKISSGLEVADMYTDLGVRMLRLNMTGNVHHLMRDYNRTVNHIFRSYDEMSQGSPEDLEPIGETLSNNTRRLESNMPSNINEDVKDRMESVINRAEKLHDRKLQLIDGRSIGALLVHSSRSSTLPISRSYEKVFRHLQ